jgi:PAS domain S-box-containing protein
MPAEFHGYESIVNNSPDAISLLNIEGEVLYSSLASRDLFGYQPSQLVGHNVFERIHPDDRESSMRSLQEVMGEPFARGRWEARMRRKDGSYCWIESAAANLLQDVEVRAIVMHQRDIHDRRAAEESRRKKGGELEQSNLRMEEFAYTVAHDLREPLHAVSVCTEVLIQKLGLDEETEKMAEFLLDSTARMSQMVTDLLSFARTGLHAPAKLVSLSNVLSQVLKSLSLEIKKGSAVVTSEALPSIWTDETQIVGIFQNLISNAIRYRREEPPRIDVSAERHGMDWVIRVHDNGMGIEAQYLSQVFLPFKRLVGQAIPGTGLGLAVCKKAVESLGGTIWAESEPGSGSTFTFTLPGNANNWTRPVAQTALN